MADVVDQATRSRMMSGIRGRNTKPELILRRGLHKEGLRFRLHVPKLPGRPDIVLPRFHAAILVHGCFWHRHEGCHWCSTPSSNSEFWARKFERTVERDLANAKRLSSLGWRVALIWECSLKKHPAETIENVAKWVRGRTDWLETGIVRPRS